MTALSSSRLPVSVRLATPDDLPAVTDLMAVRDDYYARWTGKGSPPNAQPLIEAALFGSAPAARALLAHGSGDERPSALPGALLGALYVCRLFPGESLREGLFVKDLFVRPAAQRQGVGAALIAAAKALAQDEGADRLELHVVAENEAAAAFYAALGFGRQTTLVFRRDF